MRKAFLLLFFTCISFLPVLAQTYDSALDKTVVANGKLGVVVLVLATIFAGILLFLVYLERRIRRFEKELTGR